MIGHLRALYEELQRQQMVDIQNSFCDEAKQTILTATANENGFILARLTSSDIGNSIARLPERLTGFLLL